MLAVNRGDSAKRIQGFVDAEKWTFTMLHADGDADVVDAIADKYGVTGYPSNIVIGKDGKVVNRCISYDENLLREALEKALK